jgi:ParB family chromosome partitioning protein
MTKEEIENKITKLKIQKKLKPKEQWELKKLQNDLDKLQNQASSGVGIFVNEDNYQEVDITKIETNPYQNRTIFDEERIKELAESIAEIGLIQPISIAVSGDKYTLISGERRYRAYKSLDKKTIPAILKYNISDSELEEMALVENLAREDINIYDETLALAKLHKRGLSYSQIASKIGKSKTSVARVVSIANIENELLKEVANHNIYKPKLLELIAKKEPKEQKKLVDRLINNDLSLKELEKKEENSKEEKPKKEPKSVCNGAIIKSQSKTKLTLELNLKEIDKESLKKYIDSL